MSKLKNSISDKYRKYIISIILNEEQGFALWGSDMSDNEIDKLLINRDKKILTFDSIERLLKYILKNQHLLFDKANFISWTREFKEANSYAIYNLDNINHLLNTNFRNIEDLKKEICINIIDFINLFQDYAYQVSDKSLLDKLQTENNTLFKEYVYDSFIWTSKQSNLDQLKNRLKIKFNFLKFKEDITDLLALFMSSCSSPVPGRKIDP